MRLCNPTCTSALLAAAIGLSPSLVHAQTGFVSGSNGSDGALNIAANQGMVLFTPTASNLDMDGDGVFHFTTITVGAGTTLRMRADTPGLAEGRPVVWLATGAVNIAGNLNLDGDTGHAAGAFPTASVPGAGGFAGGPGGTPGGGAPTGGSGPGGGNTSPGGVHAGHFRADASFNPGQAYGNAFLIPLLGGSGGGGGVVVDSVGGCGGAGGGGALLIASSVSLAVEGTISARGGPFPTPTGCGMGSGGAVRLMAPLISGTGTVDVRQGNPANGGSPGRIRVETFRMAGSLTYQPSEVFVSSAPAQVFPPAAAPSVRVTAVGGTMVTATPLARFDNPDVLINTATPVMVDIAAANVPVGTRITLRFVPEGGGAMNLLSGPLAGTLAASTAQVGPLAIPAGFHRFFVIGTWTP